MDPTEDLSARVLLKHILTTEPPRTPVTSSDSQEPSGSGTRRSGRLSKKDAGAQTPQEILRRSMRHKLHESITRKSLPATRRRTASVVLKKINMPATSSSVLINDGDTPRHILMNVLRTEPVKSPVVHEKQTSKELEPPSANSTFSRARPSMELSGLDLPDVTIGHAASTAKGLSRKRPCRSLNVTAFEKRLKDGDDTGEETEQSVDDNSSLSVLSSTSLNLKTPFVDVKTEKRGLQRKVSNRRKISEEEFGTAVDKRQMGGVSSFAPAQQDLSESAQSEGITLGLSKLSEPDITADILNCNTALYAQPDAMTSSFNIIATQDKPTVMASQLQRDMREMESEEQMEVERSKLETDQLMYVFPSEDESDKKEGRRTIYGQPEDIAMVAKAEREEDVVESQTSVSDTTQFEEGENRVEAQREEEHAADSQLEEGIEAELQAEEEEAAADSKTEEEEVEGVADSRTHGDAADSQSDDGDEAGSQSEEDENLAESQTGGEEEKSAGESHTGFQSEEDAEESSQSEEEELVPDFQTEEEEEGTAGYQTDVAAALPVEDVEVSPQRETNEAVSQDENDCELVNNEKGEEASEQLQRDLQRISRRAHLSEGGLIMPVKEAAEDFPNATVAGCSDAKFEAHGTLDLHSSFEIRSRESGWAHTGDLDLAESSTQGQTGASGTENKPHADNENSFPPPEGTYDIEEGGGEALPEEVPDQDAVEPDDEGDDEENEEFPCKTPAFVREKMNFNRPDPLTSPSVLKNVQASTSGTRESLPAAKSKQKQVRKTRMSKKETVLPKSYLMGVFKHFAKTKVSADVYPVLNEIMDKFFDRLAEDLETYARHAKRKTIEVEDVVLLLKRQGYVNDKVPVEVLIEKYLRMDQRRLLIPIATSGNVVIPAKRW